MAFDPGPPQGVAAPKLHGVTGVMDKDQNPAFRPASQGWRGPELRMRGAPGAALKLHGVTGVMDEDQSPTPLWGGTGAALGEAPQEFSAEEAAHASGGVCRHAGP